MEMARLKQRLHRYLARREEITRERRALLNRRPWRCHWPVLFAAESAMLLARQRDMARRVA